METQTIEIPKETIGLKTDAEKALAAAQKMVINNNDDYKSAADQVKSFISQEKELNKKKKELLDPLNKTKKGIIDWFSGPLDFLEKAKKAIKKSMITYDDLVEEERKKEQARLDAETEKERKRLAKLAEKRAETQMKKGNVERAEEIIDEVEQETATIVAPVASVAKPNAGRVGIKETWSAEVVDLMEMCKAVVAGRAPLNVIAADMKVLNQMARASKSYFHVPGIKAVSKRG